MNVAPQSAARSVVRFTALLYLLCVAFAVPCIASAYRSANSKPMPSTVKVNLSEWKIQLAPARVPAGPVVFEVTNTGTIAHSFEVEGRGLEKSTPRIQPGTSARLNLDLRAGSYEAYCPVGKGSHKMLGMMNHLVVGGAKLSSALDDGDAAGKRGRGPAYGRRYGDSRASY